MSTPFPEQVEQWVASKQLTRDQGDDLLSQKAAFDAARETIESSNQGQCVGFAGGEMFVADSVAALLDKAKQAHPERQVYFESVGSCLFEEY